MSSIDKAALSWFRNKRPKSMTEHEHAMNYAVNCMTDAEKRLARAVAKLILEKHKVKP